MKKLLYLSIFIFAFCLLPKTAEAGIIFKPVFQAGLVGYWNFQEGAGINVYDKTGYDNDGTWAGTGSHWANGKIGEGGNFNGSNDYVNVGNPAELQLGNTGTLSLWLKFSSNNAPNGVISKNEGVGDTNGYMIWVGSESPGNVIIGEICNGSSNNRIQNSVSLNDNNWHHIVFAWDGSFLYLYIDGVSAATPVAQTLTPVSNVYDLHIGKISSSVYYYGGKIDEVRIYNRALSADEVQRVYKLSQPKFLAAPRNGLVGYWSFEEGIGTKVHDYSGNGNHGTWNGSGSHWADGKFGKGGNFNGSGDYVAMGDVLNFGTGDFTITAWIKHVQSATFPYWEGIVDKCWSTNWSFYGTREGYSSIPCIGFAIAGNYSTERSGATPVTDGKWHHVAVVADRDNVATFYVDGKVDGDTFNISGSSSVNLSSGSGYTVRLGMQDCNNMYWNGSIDEVRTYNRALETSEITALYNSGLQKINASQNNQLTNSLVGLWSFNGPDIDGNEAIDRSGNGNNGTITGATPINGKVGQALDFDGVDDYIVGTGYEYSIYTMSAWIKVSGTISNWKGIVAYTDSSGNRREIGLNGSGTPIIVYGSQKYKTSLGSDLDDNAWHYVVGTYDGSTAQLYIDGVSVSLGSEGTGGAAAGTNIMWIGRLIPSTENNYRFTGKIDEVRIYNRVLTAQEVLRLYNLGR